MLATDRKRGRLSRSLLYQLTPCQYLLDFAMFLRLAILAKPSIVCLSIRYSYRTDPWLLDFEGYILKTSACFHSNNNRGLGAP